MKIETILNNVEFTVDKEWESIKDIEVKDIAYNSLKSSKDTIFVAIKGEITDGHKYASAAYEKGARVFVINEEVDLPGDSVKIHVQDSRDALSKMSANLFGHPSKSLTIVGVTGTKGKTTTCNYIKNTLQASGAETGIIGTNGIFYKTIAEDSLNTTPESYELQKTLSDMLKAGVSHVVMEVSSGGLMMKRVQDIDIDVGVFTNISPDHIGPREHPNFNHYLETKSSLFEVVKHGIINIDDEHSQYIINKARCGISTISLEKPSDFQVINIELSKFLEALGSKFTCKMKEGDYDFELTIPGRFNIYNALSAIAACSYLKIPMKTITQALKDTRVEGRAEVLPILDYASVIVDFAHNGVSLKNILSTLNEYKPNRLICLTGSVGNRTQIRRKEMGDAAAGECDVCILTADNPDTEDPNKIIDEISLSFKDSPCVVIKEADRKKAINLGIEMLEKGDIFLIAGKGHERYDLVNGVREYFCDQEVAIEAAKNLLSKG